MEVPTGACIISGPRERRKHSFEKIIRSEVSLRRPVGLCRS
jgi:hypothetical protein